jgi:Rps23 Pro-64 3,4-dihydroxylase Tpa1-like proline 4-hydroxylase
MSKEQIVELILQRLNDEAAALKSRFKGSVEEGGVGHCVVDKLLPVELAERIYNAFPAPESMRLMASFREKKYTSKNYDEFDPLLKDIMFAMQDERVIALVSEITGIREQIPDSSLYAGGLSAMTRGHYLSPHIDNSHEASRRFYRTLNLLYYVTPGWELENGGNLELWDRDVRKNTIIVSSFNRLAIMETTPTSWHSVSPVIADGTRCCVSNYFFSPQSPTGVEYFNVTSFSARPEQPFNRLLARIDNSLRQTIRKFVPHGVGKKDVYEGPKP